MEMSLVETKVREGTRLSDALAQSSLFPATAARLVEVGERSGSLGDTLLQASNIMGDANTARIERIVSLVNPNAIIILGAIVALLVAGVMLGIFSLGDFAG
jgi:type II secretory pathway component PulF